MADEPKAEAPPPESSDQKAPEETAPAPDQAPADTPAAEAPPAEEAKPEGGGAEAEADKEATTAAEHEGAEGTAEEAASASAETPSHEASAVKVKSSRTLAEQKKSVERLSAQKQPSKFKEGEAKKKSKSIIFVTEEVEKPEEVVEPTTDGLSLEEGSPSDVEAKIKLTKRKSKVKTPDTKARQTVAGRARRTTVFRAKGDFEGKPRYQNTYRLESNNPFSPDRVYTIIKTTMDAALQDIRYNPEECSKLVASISEEIRNKVKLQCYDRYKIAVQVFIGERKEQSVYSIMRPLWDVERDHYSIYSYENTTLFAIGLAIGTYFE